MPHFISTRVLIIAKYKNIYNIYDIQIDTKHLENIFVGGWWVVYI